jgi:hypothetical protein
MNGRANISSCQKILLKMSFKKQQSGGVVGLLLKQILCGNDFQKEFNFLKKDEISRIIEYGAELWIILKKML